MMMTMRTSARAVLTEKAVREDSTEKVERAVLTEKVAREDSTEREKVDSTVKAKKAGLTVIMT